MDSRRISDLWYGNASEQYLLLLCKNNEVYCVYTRIVSTQDPCACTRFLCMHKILVHAQHSLCMHNILVHALEGPGTKAGTQKKAAAPGRTCGCFVLGPGLGLWPLQCMHKSVVHAQESCACARILRMHKNVDVLIIIIMVKLL